MDETGQTQIEIMFLHISPPTPTQSSGSPLCNGFESFSDSNHYGCSVISFGQAPPGKACPALSARTDWYRRMLADIPINLWILKNNALTCWAICLGDIIVLEKRERESLPGMLVPMVADGRFWHKVAFAVLGLCVNIGEIGVLSSNVCSDKRSSGARFKKHILEEREKLTHWNII